MIYHLLDTDTLLDIESDLMAAWAEHSQEARAYGYEDGVTESADEWENWYAARSDEYELEAARILLHLIRRPVDVDLLGPGKWYADLGADDWSIITCHGV